MERKVLDVEYWGTLDRSLSDVPIPQDLHGVLRIDLSLAPPDSDPLPALGVYNWNHPGPGFVCPKRDTSGFVTDLSLPIDGASADNVFVRDAGALTSVLDDFSLTDHEDRTNDDGSVDFHYLSLFVEIPMLDFIHGDSLAQSFDVTVPPPPSDRSPAATGLGFVSDVIRGITKLYSFSVDRLRVTPRVCKI